MKTISPAARRLRELRKAKGLSLRKLASETGISFGYICDMENGRAPVQGMAYYTSMRFCKVLAVDIHVLMSDEEDV